ncbi:hypothetical protein F5Y09DRAFT_293692 [Xylaria sp. FL1042]|nr:hypothetical protein F5Y09DRAFT_293692 [Xylaria sp. FL1042]
MDQDHIDGLLERYLYLLHDYTTLREELTALQTGMYQNIARANFAAERGLRFGQDSYDDRMQASRRLAISCDSQDQNQAQNPSESQDRKNPVVPSGIVTSFTVVNPTATILPAPASRVEDSAAKIDAPNPHPHPSPEAEAGASAESAEQSAPNIEARSAPPEPDAAQLRDNNPSKGTTSSPPPPPPPPLEVAEKDPGIGTETGIAATPQKKPNANDDPLRWFGLLTPMPLRQAQAQSVRAVEHVIPRLASLNAEMAAVEIEVRRARKRRAKLEAAAASKPS